MTFSIDTYGHDLTSFAGSASRSELSITYSIAADAALLFILVGSSTAPDWTTCTIDGQAATLIQRNETTAAQSALFVIDVQASGISTTGSAVVTASSGANNRSVIAYLSVHATLDDPGWLLDSSNGSTLPDDYDISVPASSSNRLVFVAGRAESNITPTASGSAGGASFTTITSGVTNPGFIGNGYIMGLSVPGDATTVSVDGSADTNWLILDINEQQRPYQGWPLGGNIHAPSA